MLVQEIINSILQLAVALLIAWAVWLVFARTKAAFRAWVGLTKPTARAMGVAVLLLLAWSAFTFLIYLWPDMRAAATADNTVAGTLRAHGFSGEIVGVILVTAAIKTAAAEEIVFRGLIAKRLIGWLGFGVGNAVHAVLFGAIHLLVFVVPGGAQFSLPLGAAFVAIPGVGGWLMAYANARAGNGSIAPGWLIHAAGNAVSYPVLAFAW